MDGSTAVWLALTLAAPVTLVPEIALLRLIHSRRAGWHPLDVLIVSLLVGQLCCTLVTFGLSASTLLRNAGLWPSLQEEEREEQVSSHHQQTPFCAALVSCWSAAHTLHAATLTSLAVDRAMTIRWPYKYRLSVRRTQVRYHVVVLAIVSLLVGVAGLFAGTGPSLVAEQAGCSFLPYTFDSRFSLFWLCLHGILLAATLTSAIVILATRIVTRCCPSFGPMARGSGSDMRTLGNVSEGSSSATLPLPCGPPRYTPGPAAATAAAAAQHLHRHHHISPALNHPTPALMFGGSTLDNKTAYSSNLMLASTDSKIPVPADSYPSALSPGNGSGWNRQRHSTVAAVLIVAYLTHHVPLLVLTTLGTYFSSVLPADWPYSAMVLSSSLLSGLLFMAVLVFIDPVTHGWMVDSLKPSSERRRPHRLGHSPVTSEGTLEQHNNTPPTKIDEENRYRMSQIYDPSNGGEQAGKFPLTNGSLFVHLMNPAATAGSTSSSSSSAANRRPSRMGISAYDRQQQRASHLLQPYPLLEVSDSIGSKPPPTLSTFMSRSKILMLASNNETKPADLQQEPIYASLSETLSSCNTLGSTAADDPVMVDDDDEGSATESAGDDFEFHNIRSSRQTLVATTPEVTATAPINTFGLEDLKPRSRIARSATYRILCNGLDVKCAKRDDPTSTLSAVSESQHGVVTCVTIQVEESREGSLRRSKMLTSLSMNDIDIIGDDGEEECDEDGLPARSDSLFSLPSAPEENNKEYNSSGSSSGSPLESKSLIRSSIELSRVQHLNEHGRRRRLPHYRHQAEPSGTSPGSMLHFRKKSFQQRSRLQHRFQQRQKRVDNGIVTIAALKAALSQSAVSYLDTGDTVDHVRQQGKKTAVFVSEYL